MQAFLAKYGLAAHLAILVVAPLLLYPYCTPVQITPVLLWLSGLAAIWVMFAPSVRGYETMHRAVSRVAGEMVRDPLLWISLVLVVLTGIRALNTGVEMAYDPEAAAWSIAAPKWPLLPGCFGACGDLPFAAAVAFLVLAQGCRHALGRSARQCFLLIAAALSGLGATLMIFLANQGHAKCLALMNCVIERPSFIGVAFGVFLLAGTVSLVSTLENRWVLAMPLIALSVGGNGAGLFAYAPPYISAVFGVAEVLLMIYCFIYTNRLLKASADMKGTVIAIMALTLGALFVMAVVPADVRNPRLAAYMALDLLPTAYLGDLNRILSAISLKTWMTNLWTGSGLGSFALDIRFNAMPADWAVLSHEQVAATNGGWHLLAERGVIGAVSLAMVLGYLFYRYVRRFIEGLHVRVLPQPTCLAGLLACTAVIATIWSGCSFLRPDVLLATGTLLALATNSFPRRH